MHLCHKLQYCIQKPAYCKPETTRILYQKLLECAKLLVNSSAIYTYTRIYLKGIQNSSVQPVLLQVMAFLRFIFICFIRVGKSKMLWIITFEAYSYRN